MGSHVIDVLRQGIWSSLTGGWFYDPHQSLFSNTLHLYIWLFFLIAPFIIHLTLVPSVFIWLSYCTSIGIVFAFIKWFNNKLHHMYDTTEVIEEKKENKETVIDLKNIDNSNEGNVAIEMVNLEGNSTSNATEENGMDIDSSKVQVSGTAPLAVSEIDEIECKPEKNLSKTEEKERDIDDPLGAVGGNQGDEKDENRSNQITTTADVEINQRNSDVEEGEVLGFKVREGEGYASEDSNYRICKRRKAIIRRTKSSLESSTPEVSSGNNLAQGQEPHTECEETKDDENDSDDNEVILRSPKSERSQVISPEEAARIQEKKGYRRHGFYLGSSQDDTAKIINERRQKKKSMEKFEREGTPIPERSISQHVLKNSPEKQAVKYNRSYSVDETHRRRMSQDAKDSASQPSGQNNSAARKSRRSQSERVAAKPKHMECDFRQVDKEFSPTKLYSVDSARNPPHVAGDTHDDGSAYHSSDDWSDMSDGEIAPHVLGYGLKRKDKDRLFPVQEPVRHACNSILDKSDLSKDASLGAVAAVCKSSYQSVLNGNPVDESMISHQSSSVGLDWLFNTDSESSSADDTSSWYSDSSTITEEGRSPDHLPSGGSKMVDKQTETEPKVPGSVDLDVMRKQGAIPKLYNGRPLPPLPPIPCSSHSTDEASVSTSPPHSGELSDPDDIRRKILEILNEPGENPEQMKKLISVVIEAKGRRVFHHADSPHPDRKRRVNPELRSRNVAHFLECANNSAQSSKAPSPTENSALLPVSQAPVEDRHLRRRRSRGDRKSKTQSRHDPSEDLPPFIPSSTASGRRMHMASSHDDTSDGAIHRFQDETGQWFSYTFGELSPGYAERFPETSVVPMTSKTGMKRSESSEFSEVDPDEYPEVFWKDSPVDLEYVSPINAGNMDDRQSSSRSNSMDIRDKKPKHFHKLQILPCWTKTFIKIHLDRLELLALLDRNIHTWENIASVFIAMAVAALGAWVLSKEFFYDFWTFLFCFIMASCHYSLIKSVQPDAASPMHGYNRIVVFSRPVYFIVCCSLLLLLDFTILHVPSTPTYIYGIPVTVSSSLIFARDFMKVFILCFPLIFTLGFLPQVNTFAMYLLEQIDMHTFGGNASVSLGASVYCIIRSLFAVSLLYGICFLAVQVGDGAEIICQQKLMEPNVVFSVFSALVVAMAYHLSRCAADPSVLWMLIRDLICGKPSDENEEKELIDPLPDKLKKCVSQRLQADLLIILVVLVIVFAIHLSTVFSSPALQPMLSTVVYYMAGGLGFLIHYLIPMLRKEMPWQCLSHPILPSREREMFEVEEPPQILFFEKLYVWLRFVERNILYPFVFLCAQARSTPDIMCKFGTYVGPLVISVCTLKLLRFSFSDTPKQYLIITFTVFFFQYDCKKSETFLIDYFFISILFCKFCDLLLKMKFILTYIAPWQITWGSATHAFAQPFSVPHSAMLFLQATVSAIFSTPLNPFLGSAIFITSYARPVKFWERDYNTKRVDHTNTRLSSQLEKNPGADDNNLNSIFYEHLTRSLQHSLCGDLMMGRWGNAEQGDCFIMASDYLNALVHIVEMGNGLVTFQLRGLEFRGTYCQQREVEAISEGVEDNEGFFCCEPGHLPHFLSLNAAFQQRWLAWEVVVTKYVLEGYSISDISALSMVQGYDSRKMLIYYYIMSMIYYTVRSPRLEEWLEMETIQSGLDMCSYTDEDYSDPDPTFNTNVDDDYDKKAKGVSRNKFCRVYHQWITYCVSRRDKEVDCEKKSLLVSLCFALSLLGRRTLGTASMNTASSSMEYFLYGLHALFKGDFRITSQRDEWVFADMELLRRVVAPAIRMALKLHQDHFLFTDEYEDVQTLYNSISNYEKNLVICHEADPKWRNAVLSNTPSLLAFRHVFDEGLDEYKVIMLNKKFLTFRIVKVNKECVRGLWAGQQQELIYLRNRNPERGSIQNAKQALRNMINSSCDQPIGYPIYVSPLTTSYSSTHSQLASVLGKEFILANVKNFFQNMWFKMHNSCGATCSGSSSGYSEDVTYSCTPAGAAQSLGSAGQQSRTGISCSPASQQDIPLGTLSPGNRNSLISTTSSASKPSTLVPLAIAGFINEMKAPESVPQKVRITDPSKVYGNINLGRRIDVQWPNDEWRQNGGRTAWAGWMPSVGMEGVVVHKWEPCHREIIKRSHVDKTILLVQVNDKYVPILEAGVSELGAEV